MSSSLTFIVLGWSPADLTASFQLEKHCETEYSEISASPTNSERVGARPSPLAMAAMEFRMWCLSGMCSLLWPRISAIACAEADLYAYARKPVGQDKLPLK